MLDSLPSSWSDKPGLTCLNENLQSAESGPARTKGVRGAHGSGLQSTGANAASARADSHRHKRRTSRRPPEPSISYCSGSQGVIRPGVEILFDFFLAHALIIVPSGEGAADEGGPFEPDFSAADLMWRLHRTAAGGPENGEQNQSTEPDDTTKTWAVPSSASAFALPCDDGRVAP
jgi:hypothetical protein